MTAAAQKIPTFPPQTGVSFHFIGPAPLTEVHGTIDIQCKLLGMSGFDTLQTYVDGVPLGTAMPHCGRNRFVSAIDTAIFEDGIHRIAVAALDDRDKFVNSTFLDLRFRNIQNFHFLSILPNEAGTGFVMFLKVHTLRTELPAERFLCNDNANGEDEVLESSVSYDGSTFNGVPVVRLECTRSRKAELESGSHRLKLTLTDRDGVVRFATNRTLYVP
jgi:hypothetical protein